MIPTSTLKILRLYLTWPAHLYVGAIIFSLVWLLYGGLMQYSYTGDDLQAAMVIEHAVTGETFDHPTGTKLAEIQPDGTIHTTPAVPINPRYLLEFPTSVFVFQEWRALGWKGDVLVPILAFRALVGALGILFFFLAVFELSSDEIIAGLSSLGLATSVAYWTYSTHLDQSINMVALASLGFYLLARLSAKPAPTRTHLPLALVLTFATLYNLTAVFTALAFDIALAARRSAQALRTRIKSFFAFGLTFGTLVLAFLLVGVALLSSPANLLSSDYWRAASFQGHPEWGFNPLPDLLRAGLGFAKAQITYPMVIQSLQTYWGNADIGQRIAFLGYNSFILVIMAIPFGVLFWRRRHLQGHAWIVSALLLWFLWYGLFGWFWDPGYIKYWIVSLMLWWAIVALTLSHIKVTLPQWYRAALIITTLFGLWGFVINFNTKFLPESRKQLNVWLPIAESLKQTEPDALFISTGYPPSGHLLDFYIAYFTRRDIVSTDLISYSAGGDQEVMKRIIRSQVEDHRLSGSPLYLYGLDALTGAERSDFLNLLPPGELRVVWSFPQVVIYQLVPRSSE